MTSLIGVQDSEEENARFNLYVHEDGRVWVEGGLGSPCKDRGGVKVRYTPLLDASI